MSNKKLIILIVLVIAAVFSLIYGIIAPPKGSKRALRSSETSALCIEREVSIDKDFSLRARNMERTEFESWGRNPFVLGQQDGSEIILNGIMWFETNPKAMVNGEIVGVSSKIGPYVVVEIKKDSIIVNDGIKDLEVKLE